MNAQQAKFQLEFMLLMLNSGRLEEADMAFQKVLEYLQEKAEEEAEEK